MKVKYYDNKVHIELVGDMAFNNAQALRDAINKSIRATDKIVVVNLSKVDFVDSAGLGILITLLKRVKQQQGRLIIEYPQLGVQRFLEMTRLDELIEVHKKEEPTTGSWPDAEL